MAKGLAGRFELKPIASINMTPMVPALLAVLVVSMVSAAPRPKALAISTVEGVPPPPSVVRPLPVVVTMLGEGRYELNGERMGADLLKIRVAAFAAERDGLRRIRVQANDSLPYSEVVAVIAHLKSVGLGVEFWPAPGPTQGV